MIRSVRPPFFCRWFSPDRLLCREEDPGRRIFLTFDDGPVPDTTPQVLKFLSDVGVKATFFHVGDNIRKHSLIFEEVRAAGHAIGNHTFHHLDGWKTAPAAYAEDVRRFDSLCRTKLFRPPYGRFTPSQYMILRKDYRFVLWSLLTWDFSSRVKPEECLSMATGNTRPGDIIVFHDNPRSEKNLLYALPRYLEACLKKGFEFDVLSSDQIIPSSAKLR